MTYPPMPGVWRACTDDECLFWDRLGRHEHAGVCPCENTLPCEEHPTSPDLRPDECIDCWHRWGLHGADGCSAGWCPCTERPACPHPPDAILANEFNKAVQCHRCGHVFEWLDGEPWEYVDAQRVTP